MAVRQLSQEMIFICLKFGITYKSVQIDKSNPNVLNELQKHAVEMVSSAIGSLEVHNHRHHIKLFLISPDHQPASLKLVTRASDLSPTCFIEIIIWRSDQETVTPARDHILVEHSYKRPTYCSACEYFMWGLIRQGKRCRVCRRDFHHQCAEHLPATCPGHDARRSSLMRRASSNTTLSSVPDQVYVDGDYSNVAQTPPKRTKIAKLLNVSITKRSSANSKTSGNVPSSASSVISTKSKADMNNKLTPESNAMHDSTNASTPNSRRPYRKDQESNSQVNVRTPPPTAQPPMNMKPDRRKDIKLTNCQERDGIWTATGQFGRESRHSKRIDIAYDKKKFKFIQKDEQGNKQAFEIPVTEIEAARSQATNDSPNSTMIESMSGVPSSQVVVCQKLACLLLDTINEAAQSTKDRKARSSFKMVRGTENDTKDFSDLYDMNEKEILGMGRFGMVFGGTMRRNGVRVAIKKIQMTQCSQKDRENIEQEAAYLFQLNHTGQLFVAFFLLEKKSFIILDL